MKTLKVSSQVILGLALLVLPQCDWMNKEKDKATTSSAQTKKTVPAEKIMLTAQAPNADVQLTVDEYEAYKQQAIEAQPQLAQIIAMPGYEKQLLWEQVVTSLLADLYVRDKGIDQQPEYQKELNQIVKLAKWNLAVKHFVDKLKKEGKLEVSDNEARQFYNSKKDQFVKEKGGVEALGVKFETEDAAKAFLDSVKGKLKEFDKLAKEAKKDVRNFSNVTKQSFDVPEKPLREKLASMTSFPSVEMIKASDKSFWVVEGISKKETKYVPFDEIKENLKSWLESQKVPEIIADETKKLRKQYNVKENVTYFDKNAPQPPKPKAVKQPKAVTSKKAAAKQAPKAKALKGQLKGA